MVYLYLIENDDLRVILPVVAVPDEDTLVQVRVSGVILRLGPVGAVTQAGDEVQKPFRVFRPLHLLNKM